MIKLLLEKLRGKPSLQEEMTSVKLRQVYQAQGRTIGLYSYGCFDMGRIAAGTTIGRYCSFAPTARVHTRNHGLGFLGLTPYFYEPALGLVDEDPIPFNRLEFLDDVWVGANAVILPSAEQIGRGAVIGAGSIVTRPVPNYAIVAGNPARVIRMRFDESTIAGIEATRWWECDLQELAALLRSNPALSFTPATYFHSKSTAIQIQRAPSE